MAASLDQNQFECSSRYVHSTYLLPVGGAAIAVVLEYCVTPCD
jgi:hypothetical protein